MLSSPEPEPGQGGASLITIHWQLQESQHLLSRTELTRSAFIILVTLHLSDVTWYETLSLCLMADVWYSLDRDTQGRGSGNPRLLMSRWGSGAQPERQHLLIFHPVHLHNKQETHQVSQLNPHRRFLRFWDFLHNVREREKYCTSTKYCKVVLYKHQETSRTLLALFFLMRRIHEIFRVKREVKRQWEWTRRGFREGENT